MNACEGCGTPCAPLVAEVRRLRERNERLKQANDAEHARLVAARDRMRAERDDARAEADRLTGALGAIAAVVAASKPVRDIARCGKCVRVGGSDV